MKPINPIQKYLHIIESYASTLHIFAVIFLFPINVLITFGICSTPKLSKYVIFLAFNLIHEFLLIHSHHDLLYIYAYFF